MSSMHNHVLIPVVLWLLLKHVGSHSFLTQSLRLTPAHTFILTEKRMVDMHQCEQPVAKWQLSKVLW